MRAIRLYSMASVCLIALAFPMQAHAQSGSVDDPVEAEVTNEEIIVTARRRDERIQDVPAVINAVTAEEIAKLNFRDLREIATVAPGLELTTNSNGTGGNARLRGVNFDIFASGNNPTVEFYYNDAPITAGVLLQQMYDVGQIEVLRGPQGTLRGRASPSGSITVTTKKPDLNEFGGFADVTGNDIGTINLKGGFNVPVIKGIAAIRVAGVWDQNEADRVRPFAGTVDGRDPYAETWSGRVTALVEPADWLRAEGSYQKFDRYSRAFDQVESFSLVNPAAAATPPLVRAEDRLSNFESPRSIRQTYNIYNWRGELSLAGQQLIYQGQHYTQRITGTETQDPGNVFPGASFDGFSVSNIKSTSHEVRLQNQERVLGMFDYVVGFFDNKNNTPTVVNRPSALGRSPTGSGLVLASTAVDRTGNSHETSYFGNVTAHIGESLAISGGLRQIEYRDFSGLLAVTPGQPTTTLAQTQNVDKLIYSASIQYFLTPDIMAYASTGTSFRPGISVIGNFSSNQSALERSFQILPPETSSSYEGGVKTTLFDRRLRLNLSGYYQKFTNYPYRIPGSGIYFVNFVGATPQVSQFNFVGAVPVEVKGVEAEIGFDLSSRWNFSVVGSYSDGQIKNGRIPCTDLNSDGRPDSITTAPSLAQLQAATGTNNLSACTVSQRSAFLAPFSATVQSEYHFPLTGHTDAFLRGLFSFNGQSQGNPTSRFDDVDRFGLLNLYAGIRDPEGMWEVTVFAKNVVNENKVLTRTDPLSTSYRQLPTFAATTFTSAYNGITMTPPREFGLNVKFMFGSR